MMTMTPMMMETAMIVLCRSGQRDLLPCADGDSGNPGTAHCALWGDQVGHMSLTYPCIKCSSDKQCHCRN